MQAQYTVCRPTEPSVTRGKWIADAHDRVAVIELHHRNSKVIKLTKPHQANYCVSHVLTSNHTQQKILFFNLTLREILCMALFVVNNQVKMSAN